MANNALTQARPLVQARWGDYHLQTGDRAAARAAYQAAMQLDPADQETAGKLAQLQ